MINQKLIVCVLHLISIWICFLQFFILDQMLKNFTLTYVLYEDNPIDLAMALVSFSPLVLLILLAARILFARCLETMNLTIGLLFSSLVNLFLKSLICEPRPSGSYLHSYGMPR